MRSMLRLERLLDVVYQVLVEVRRTTADIFDFTLGFAFVERAGGTTVRQRIGSHFVGMYQSTQRI